MIHVHLDVQVVGFGVHGFRAELNESGKVPSLAVSKEEVPTGGCATVLRQWSLVAWPLVRIWRWSLLEFQVRSWLGLGLLLIGTSDPNGWF